MDSLHYKVKTRKADIAYVNFIFEAYDGIAAITTLDPDEGLLDILVAPDYEADFKALAAALGREMEFRVV